jgi:hypothetical protein
LASGIVRASTGVQDLRTQAEQSIGSAVTRVNELLKGIAASDRRDDLLHAHEKGGRIVSVEFDPLKPVSSGAGSKILARSIVRDRRILADQVVLAHEDDRQFPNASQVHGFMDRADAGRSIAEIDDDDAIFLAQRGCQSQSICNRSARTDDRRRQHRTGARTGYVGRPALPFVDTSGAAKGFGKQTLKFHTLRDLVVDASIGGDHIIFGVEQLGKDGRNGFLAGHGPVSEFENATRQPRLDGLVHLMDTGHLAINFLEDFRFHLAVRSLSVRHPSSFLI